MNVNPSRHLPLLLLSFFVASIVGSVSAQQPGRPQPAKSARAKARPGPAAGSQLLFGTLPVSTKSLVARSNIEMALDQYENAAFEEAVLHAKIATDKDPDFALGYALWSFVARRGEPAPAVLVRAKSLAGRCTGDECRLITFLVNTQEANVLPAISAMNDLLGHRPRDKHILYLSSEWLYFQADYERSKQLLVKSLEIDPDFPPALNMLGYMLVETGDPEPKKAIDYLKHYAAVLPAEANPQDSLGEVLRMMGDDSGSLAHYAEALQMDPHRTTAQFGRGDTYAMMGNFSQAKSEYQKALVLSTNLRDTIHIQFQMAMLRFWTGDASGGRAELAELADKVSKENDAAALFEVEYARALLSPNLATERQQLQSIEAALGELRPGMQEADRNAALANVLREEVRVAVALQQSEEATAATRKLEQLADSSRDRMVETVYDSAQGYLSLGASDYQKACEQLSVDLHTPMVVRDYIRAQEKLGDQKGIESARRRLRYLRNPTAEWFVVAHDPTVSAQIELP